MHDLNPSGVSVLFSEPKIPQNLVLPRALAPEHEVSVLFSEPKIPQNAVHPGDDPAPQVFQCSSASRKFLKPIRVFSETTTFRVSVLFSEPKIPQTAGWWTVVCNRRVSFSALQRAENSSNPQRLRQVVRMFRRFQCSSASRKFLKFATDIVKVISHMCFSALQRAENSSNGPISAAAAQRAQVSVLFSEPKIPQSASGMTMPLLRSTRVSVLFSEPKIPQIWLWDQTCAAHARFSALQRAENSSNQCVPDRRHGGSEEFQCSSASRKFLKTY